MPFLLLEVMMFGIGVGNARVILSENRYPTPDQVRGRIFRITHYCATAALSRQNGVSCTRSRRASFGKAWPTTNVLNASVC